MILYVDKCELRISEPLDELFKKKIKTYVDVSVYVEVCGGVSKILDITGCDNSDVEIIKSICSDNNLAYVYIDKYKFKKICELKCRYFSGNDITVVDTRSEDFIRKCDNYFDLMDDHNGE